MNVIFLNQLNNVKPLRGFRILDVNIFSIVMYALTGKIIKQYEKLPVRALISIEKQISINTKSP